MLSATSHAAEGVDANGVMSTFLLSGVGSDAGVVYENGAGPGGAALAVESNVSSIAQRVGAEGQTSMFFLRGQGPDSGLVYEYGPATHAVQWGVASMAEGVDANGVDSMFFLTGVASSWAQQVQAPDGSTWLLGAAAVDSAGDH
jgi:hypothetical protein